MSDFNLSALHASIRDAYGSPTKPDFSFVKHLAKEQPYRGLVNDLSRFFAVEETTDLNDDVSFAYALQSASGKWTIMLSMLGPYAVVLRLEARSQTVLPSDGIQLHEDERTLLRVLSAHQIHPLDRAVLDVPVQLELHNTNPGRVRIFQALFTDTDVLPWEV